MIWLLAVAVTLGIGNAICLVLLLRRGVSAGFDPACILSRLEGLDHSFERLERSTRSDLAQNRNEFLDQARSLREELAGSVQSLGTSLGAGMGAIGTGQKEQLALFAQELKAFREGSERGWNDFSASVVKSVTNLGHNQCTQLTQMNAATDQKLESVRAAVEQRLKALQDENASKLDQMRRTVDEQLQGTLERRLNESFQLVSERLEQVYKGLGEMQTLASGVGDLKKVLSDVRARGTWGEIQLGTLLEEIMTPDQFARNVATTKGPERVEFAIRLPGPEEGSTLWLPIDSKFPQEDYLRLVEASEAGDRAGMELCIKQLEAKVRSCAREIKSKYVAPPNTTDFAIMYLPTESLFAEVLRRPGLVEALQRDLRIAVTGPTTLAAFLNSLQMGFRTLAIQKRSSEVWELLGAVKTEFGKYADVLEKVHTKLDQASKTVQDGLTRTRAINRRLRGVSEMPAEKAALLLPEPYLAEPEEPAFVGDAVRSIA